VSAAEMISKVVELLNEQLNRCDELGLFSEMESMTGLCISKDILTSIRHGDYIAIEWVKFLVSLNSTEVSLDTSEKQLFQRIDGLILEVENKMLLNQEEKCKEYPHTIKIQVKDAAEKKLLNAKIDAIDCSTVKSYSEAIAISSQLIVISMKDPQDSNEILDLIAATPVVQIEDENISSALLPELFKSDCLASLAQFEIYY